MHASQLSRRSQRPAPRIALPSLLFCALHAGAAVAEAPPKPAQLPSETAHLTDQDCTHDAPCKAMIEQAKQHSEAGQFEAALAEYRRAYARRPVVSLLINIGRMEQRAGRPQQAIAAYKRFLESETAQRDATLRATAQRYLQEAESQLPHRAEIAAPPPQPPTVPSGDKVPLAVQAKQPDSIYLVQIDQSLCYTPCVVQASPGPLTVHVREPKIFDGDIVVPGTPSRVVISHPQGRRRASGIALTTIGSIFFFAGFGALAASITAKNDAWGLGLILGSTLSTTTLIGPGLAMAAAGMSQLRGASREAISAEPLPKVAGLPAVAPAVALRF